MANYCKTIFGNALLTEPLDKYPVSAPVQHHSSYISVKHYFYGSALVGRQLCPVAGHAFSTSGPSVGT